MSQTEHLTNCYRLSPKIILRSEPQYFDSYYAYDYFNQKIYPINKQVLLFFEKISKYCLCTKCITHYFEKIELKSFLETMFIENLIIPVDEKCTGNISIDIENDNWVQNIPLKDRPVAFLSAPTNVNIVITRRCNMACVHCNVAATSLQNPDLIPVKKWKNILDELEQMRVFRVILTGGEPFAYREFKELLEHYAKKRFSKIILTNGTYITDEIAKQMKKYNICPYLSLDGANEETHDVFRKYRGGFKRLLDVLKILKENKVQYNITSVINKDTINQLESMVQIANKYAADSIIFQPLKPVGRGLDANDWRLDSVEYKEIPKTITTLATQSRTNVILTQDEDFFSLGPRKEDVPALDSSYGATSCEAGTWSMTIDHDGIVYPCMLGMELQLNPICSINEYTLRELWASKNWGIFRNQKFEGCRIESINESTKKRFSRQLPIIK